MRVLAGRRILLVEDEFIVAAMAADMIEDLGAVVVGPAVTVASGLALAREEDIDAAILDVNMNGENSSAIALDLEARDVPLLYTTGYGEDAQLATADPVIVSKPYTQEELAAALTQILAKSSGR